MEYFFKSPTVFGLLAVLTKHPKRSYYLNELAKILRKNPANLARELMKLRSEGLVRVKTKNGKRFYSFNTEYPSAKELRALILKNDSDNFESKFQGGWLLAEDILNIDPFFSKIWLNCFVDEFEKPGGRAYKKIAAIYKGYHLWFYYDKEDAKQVAEHLVGRFVEDPSFMVRVNREIIKHSDVLRDYAAKLPEENLSRLSNKKLWNIYIKHEDIHTAYYQWGWIPVAADMFTGTLTERGKRLLRERSVAKSDVNDHLITLTQPTEASLIKVEQRDLMSIALKVRRDTKQRQLFQELFRSFKEKDVKEFGLYTHSPEYEAQFEKRVRDLINKIKPTIANQLSSHYAKYFYTKWIFTEEQGVYSFEHYLKELVRLVNRSKLEEEVAADERETKKAKQTRQDLIKKLRFDSRHRQFFDAWGEFMITKIYRRYAQLFVLYKMNAIIEEIGKRLGLTLKETKFMKTDEIRAGLAGGAVDIDHIKSRVKFSVYYADKYEQIFYIGQEAKKAAEMIQISDIGDVYEIKGQVGCPGYAVGTVKLINVVGDMKKMKQGDILVSISTQPDLLPAMKKAAAFVTDQGGVTSHAAIVAREMRTPCVIGTKVSTKVLRDGDKVEVDATKGIVKKIK